MDDVIPIRKPEVIAKVGGLVDESWFSLGIYGDDLDPDEISRLLGSAPSRSHRRGEPRPSSGTPWPNGSWVLTVKAKPPMGPEEMVHLLLGRLPPDEALWSDLRQRFRVRLTFLILTTRWNRGFDLSADALRRIDPIGVGVGFDIYAELEVGEG